MQHLNLYTQIEREVEPPLSARQQLRLVAAAFAVMLVLYLGLFFSAGGLSSELRDLQAKRQAVAAELKQLVEKKASLQNNPQLDAEIERLQREVAFRQRLLATIVPGDEAEAAGFARHLQGLARQHIDGLWFTEIQLHQGGQQLALLGQTRAPEYVPQYLQKLSEEPVFEGHRFRVLRLHLPEAKTRLHSFELRARDVGAVE